MSEATQRSGSNNGYLILVAGLFLLILAAVSVLWITERRNLARVEAMWRQRCMDRDKALEMLQIVQAQSSQSVDVDRGALAHRSATVDGRQRDVLQLSLGQGERLGFRGGDLVEVVPEPGSSGD